MIGTRVVSYTEQTGTGHLDVRALAAGCLNCQTVLNSSCPHSIT